MATVAAVVAVALLARGRHPRPGAASRRFRSVAARRPLAVAVVFMATLAGQVFLLPLFGVPEPQVADEFGFLLAGETFAAGRFTNPPHPLWPHFETHHVLQQPTYMAMYPPGQGLLLAAGIALWGQPIVAVWISVAAASAAIAWALQAFGAARWALVGGLLFGARLGTFTYWSWSYWGGSLAALGGALVLGGAARLGRRPSSGSALALGAGLSLLAMTRPFEGMALGLGACLAVAWRLARSASGNRRLREFSRVGLLVAVPLGATLVGLGLWNRAVTGSPWTFPYSLQRRNYAVARHLVGQAPRPEPVYRHEILRDLYAGWEPENFARFSGLGEQGLRPAAFVEKLVPVWTFFSGPVLTPALLFFPWFVARRRNALATASLGGAVLAFLAIAWWIVPHYAAPAVAGIWVAAVEGIRRLRVFARRMHLHPGAPLAAICSVLVLVSGLRVGAPWLHLRVGAWPPAWYSTIRYAGYTRGALDEDLRRRGGRHLVFVRYSPDHSPHLDWVFNGADLAGTPVLWARSMGPAADRELARHESGRTVWLLLPDVDPWRLVPYEPR